MVKIGDMDVGEFPLLLAPMEDVSDPPFRAVCKENGADVMFTEFISSEGLIRDAAKSVQKLDIFDHERPIGIQIFGGNMDSMRESAEIATTANPDIIDINYGCPVKKVTGKGAGAAILKDVPKMVEMTRQVVNSTHLPVTVKTRLGWDSNSLLVEEVTERLQDVGIKAISIHGRTRVQMYRGEADWTLIGKVKENPRITIPVFGNGDVNSPEKAREMKDRFGVDGIMIGRASIGNPWIFDQIKQYLKTGERPSQPSVDERVDTCLRHFNLSLKWKGDRVGNVEMRRHYANYFKGFRDFKPHRMRLVTESSNDSIREILEDIRIFYRSIENAIV